MDQEDQSPTDQKAKPPPKLVIQFMAFLVYGHVFDIYHIFFLPNQGH